MNESYFQSAIDDRKREVSKIVADNRIYNHLEDSNVDERNSAKNSKNTMILWLLMIVKWIKGVSAVTTEGSLKSQG